MEPNIEKISQSPEQNIEERKAGLQNLTEKLQQEVYDRQHNLGVKARELSRSITILERKLFHLKHADGLVDQEQLTAVNQDLEKMNETYRKLPDVIELLTAQETLQTYEQELHDIFKKEKDLEFERAFADYEERTKQYRKQLDELQAKGFEVLDRLQEKHVKPLMTYGMTVTAAEQSLPLKEKHQLDRVEGYLYELDVIEKDLEIIEADIAKHLLPSDYRLSQIATELGRLPALNS